MCDRAAWLDHGQLMAVGPAKEVVATYRQAQKAD
jgi:ABC-type polysaccharide/polyol phosphate transport system ATPase subunit